jgi:hypothetical protein
VKECGWQKHQAAVLSRRRVRDLGHKMYWVACWKCELELGPYPKWFAHIVQLQQDQIGKGEL